MSSVKIHIKDDIYTTVDSDIADKIKGKKLFFGGNRNYVCLTIEGKRIRLHRYIMKACPGQIVDHINRNRYDNRKNNLRLVTRSQNMLNSNRKIISSSKYFRVYKRGNAERYRVKFLHNNKNVNISDFYSKTVAALFADFARKKYSSVKPFLNFPSNIKRRHLPSVLRRTKGKIFSVVFVRRKDGQERHMVCRMNVSKNVKGKGLLFSPEHMNLLPVYDIKKKDYRFIPIENVLCLTFRKKRYRVVG